MSYLNQNETGKHTLKPLVFRAVPQGAYRIIRNCSGCKGKSVYASTGNFRVNANGGRIDVWLIYQCETCRHTYNLSIHERKKVSDIPKDEYIRFEKNDAELALAYGLKKEIFQKNAAVVCEDGDGWYMEEAEESAEMDERAVPQGYLPVMLKNPYRLKLRADKVIPEILGLSRSQVKKSIREGNILLSTDYFPGAENIFFVKVEESERPQMSVHMD